MTMADSAWINNGDNQQTWLHSCNKQHTRRMICADIADELARAADEVVSEYDNPDNGRSLRWAVDELRQALAQYRTLPH